MVGAKRKDALIEHQSPELIRVLESRSYSYCPTTAALNDETPVLTSAWLTDRYEQQREKSTDPRKS